MIDHISIAVRDLDRAARFYQAVLGAIGYEKLVVRPRTVGFGKTYPEFWLNLRATMVPINGDAGAHAALRVRRTELVPLRGRQACGHSVGKLEGWTLASWMRSTAP